MMRTTWWALSLSMLLLGCGDEEPDDSDPPAVICEDLDVDACAAESACQTIDGQSFGEDDGEVCYDADAPAEPRGCMDAGDDCGAAITYAKPSADGACVYFSSSCIPDGWMSCSDLGTVEDCPVEETACEDLDVAACSTDSACVVISGKDLVVDGDDVCYDNSAELKEVGCMDKDTGCGDAETFARPSADDACMYFSDTCIPKGWEICAEAIEDCDP